MSPYRLPSLYTLSAVVGLVLALLSDGVGDALGLGLLMLPLVGIARSAYRARSR
jgi:hypothetical protein